MSSPDAPRGAANDSAARQFANWLDAALAVDACLREAWLLEHIADSELRQRVRAVVARAEGIGDFLERPAAEALVAAEPPGASAEASAMIGPYRVVRVLGEGGMGVVYLAEQTEPVQRQLALKLLRSGFSTPEAVARFEAERRVLARLLHPNIAMLFEAGITSEGQRYFAMEHVDGLPLSETCDQARLGLEARIELFLAACDGVQHAHQKGILHRDIKPSNVLVARIGAQLIPKIIDFGISRALDAETTTGTPIGTPAYMAPENFGLDGKPGDSDLRSDVYALGVMLSELLAGVRPFGSASSTPATLMWDIAHREPVLASARFAAKEANAAREIANARGLDPHALRRSLLGDIDAIIAHATARQVADRYATVAELAADLRRHLQHEPVLAAKSTWVTRMRKLARRHRVGFLATTIALLALVAGSIGTTVGMLRAERETGVARRAQAEAEELSDFLTGLFKVSDPGRSRGENLRVREILDRAAVEVHTRFAEQPLVRARLQRTLGDVYVGLGLYPAAEPLLTESLALIDATPAAEAIERVQIRRSIGILNWREGKYRDAERVLQSALADSAAINPEIHATLVVDLATLFHEQQRLDEAEPLYRQALATRRALLGNDSPATAVVLGGLGHLLKLRQQYSESETLQREALAIRERSLGADHPDVGANLVNLSLLEIDTGQADKARASAQRAVAIWEKVYGPEHLKLPLALDLLARIASAAGDNEEAEKQFLRILAINEAGYGPQHPLVGTTLNNLAVHYLMLGRYADAEPLVRRALAIREATEAPDSVRIGYPLSTLGLVLWKRGNLVEAEPALRRTLELWQETLTEGQVENRRKSWTLWGLAGVCAQSGRTEEADALYRRGMRIIDSAPADSINLPPLRADYLAFLRAQGRADEAQALEENAESGAESVTRLP